MTEGAVLFADLQMDALFDTLDEAEACARIESATATLSQSVRACKGRVIKVIGDEVFAAFPDAGDAADAAIAMQAALSRRAPDQPDGSGLHIGIAWGPLVEQEGDLFGDTVSIAARMQSFALQHGLPIVLSGDAVARLRPGQPAARRAHALEIKGKRLTVEIFELPWK